MRRLVAAALVLAATALPARADIDISPRRPAVIIAVLSNDLEKVRVTVVQKRENPNLADEQGRTALMHAAILGNTDIVKLLLDNGARIANTDVTGSTALHWAAERGNADVVRQLVAARAPVDTDNKRGATPLMLAAGSGSAETVDLLLNAGADPKRQDYTGRSPVDYAQDKRQAVLAQKLRQAQSRR
jgi:ankyrin repeat protein